MIFHTVGFVKPSGSVEIPSGACLHCAVHFQGFFLILSWFSRETAVTTTSYEHPKLFQVGTIKGTWKKKIPSSWSNFDAQIKSSSLIASNSNIAPAV